MSRETCPSFNFTVDPSILPFAVPQQTYLSQNPDSRFHYVATGAVVFDIRNGSNPRVLLLQRSAHDTMPGKWEVPGGACDDEDYSILYGIAREMWEETGLKATHMESSVGRPHLFDSSSGKKIGKFVFVVQAERNAEGGYNVVLDPKEHQQFVWATQDQFEAKQAGDMRLEFTSQELEKNILEAFARIEEKLTQ